VDALAALPKPQKHQLVHEIAPSGVKIWLAVLVIRAVNQNYPTNREKLGMTIGSGLRVKGNLPVVEEPAIRTRSRPSAPMHPW
jgi:hypothetical protein